MLEALANGERMPELGDVIDESIADGVSLCNCPSCGIEEAKILQGFPEWFDIQEPEYKFIGNSVCPPMAEAIGKHLSNLLDTG